MTDTLGVDLAFLQSRRSQMASLPVVAANVDMWGTPGISSRPVTTLQMRLPGSGGGAGSVAATPQSKICIMAGARRV